MPPKRDIHYEIATRLDDPETALERVLEDGPYTSRTVITPQHGDAPQRAIVYIRGGTNTSGEPIWDTFSTAWTHTDDRSRAFSSLVASMLRAGVICAKDFAADSSGIPLFPVLETKQ